MYAMNVDVHMFVYVLCGVCVYAWKLPVPRIQLHIPWSCCKCTFRQGRRASTGKIRVNKLTAGTAVCNACTKGLGKGIYETVGCLQSLLQVQRQDISKDIHEQYGRCRMWTGMYMKSPRSYGCGCRVTTAC